MCIRDRGGAAAAILIQAALDKVAEISVFNIRDEFFTRAEKTIEKLHEKTDCKINLYDLSLIHIFVCSYNEIVPGHMNLDKIANAVKMGVAMAGGTPCLLYTSRCV